MTFKEWWSIEGIQYDLPTSTARAAWEAAFNEGVKWTLNQDANILNKIQLTEESE